jgi:D-alanyl-D-alanine carboxypeptidase/D-alanyl-D-alanine-endopeptidase (penicillin-binding protein 4)
MKNVRTFTIWFCAIGCLSFFLFHRAFAADQEVPKPPLAPVPEVPKAAFQDGLERIQKAGGRTGVQLVSLPSGEILCDYRSKEPFIPASLVKLLTSYSVLKRLGPSFRFRTGVYARNEPADGVVAGDIWIKGGGDPLFVSETARQLAQAMKERGIKQIRGGVFVDSGFFQPASERVCLDGDCEGSYNPVVSAAAIDFNMVTLRLSLPPKPGRPVTVDSLPAGDYARVSAAPSTGKKGGKLLRIHSLGASGNGHEEFQISGQGSSKGARAREFRFMAADPAGLFANAMRAEIEHSGIQILGQGAREGTAPAEAVMVASCESAPLSELVASMNKYSNNFMAEMLLRGMGGYVQGSPGTSAKGIDVIRTTLNEGGITDGTGMLNCGSGLSRFCRISPETFCRLLAAAWQDPIIGADFTSSLAVNAEQGTLKRRMRKPGLTVRGKTGTLSDVIGFAGYISGPSGKVYAVTIMLNEVRDRFKARQAIDSFLEEVAFSS